MDLELRLLLYLPIYVIEKFTLSYRLNVGSKKLSSHREDNSYFISRYFVV